MTSIGLISDTHGHIDQKIYHYLDGVDEIWHAGDIGNLKVTDYLNCIAPVKAVHGNIDDHVIKSTFPLDLFFRVEAVNVWMTHIGGYPGRYNKRIRAYFASNPAPDIFITGHSHILKVMRDSKNGLLHMNPGAAGVHGFHKMKTLLRFKIDGRKIIDLEAVELGKRGLVAST